MFRDNHKLSLNKRKLHIKIESLEAHTQILYEWKPAECSISWNSWLQGIMIMPANELLTQPTLMGDVSSHNLEESAPSPYLQYTPSRLTCNRKKASN